MRSIAILVLVLNLPACGGGLGPQEGPSPLGFRLTSICVPGGEPLALDGIEALEY